MDFEKQANELSQEERAQYFILTDDLGFSEKEAVEKVMGGDVCLFEGTAIDYVWEYLESAGILHELEKTNILNPRHIDINALTHDFIVGGDIIEFRYEGADYVLTNANEL